MDSLFVRVKELIEKKNAFAICLPANPTLDAVAAACAFYLALSKAGKEVSLVCESDLSAQFDLIAVDKIQSSLSSKGDNLVVSFPYTEGAIDKVTYNIDGNQFNLLIQPKAGFDRLDSTKVQFKYTGGRVDAVFVFDAPTLDALGDIYFANEDSFKGIDIVNIDRHLTNSNYGTINIVEKQSSSLSQVVFNLLKNINTAIDPDIATNLFAGIVAATNNFTAYSVNAETFDMSAQLLKAGATKKPQLRTSRQSLTRAQQPYTMSQPSAFPPAVPAASVLTEDDLYSFDPLAPASQPLAQPQPQAMPMPQPALMQQGAPAQQQQPAPNAVMNNREKAAAAPTTIEAKESTIEEQTPKDWLKPKIFKGSGGLV